jgi:hypothetical protein
MPLLNLVTIAKGAFSARTAAARVVCDTSAAWQELWMEHRADEIPAPPVPTVDFNANAVIAVFAGQRPSSGWTVDIIRAELEDVAARRGSRPLTVVYRVTGPLGPAQDVLTSPFHIVQVPKAGWDRVEFHPG